MSGSIARNPRAPLQDMKFFKKFGLLLLMLGAITLAFVLPKFVQRTQPPTPKEDLAAALAAVPIEDPAPAALATEEPEPSLPADGLKSDPRFADFFKALDGGSFDEAGAAFLALGDDVGPEVKGRLTTEMEKAIGALAPDSSTQIAAPATPAIASLAVDQASPPPAPSAPAPATAPAPEDLVRFMGRVQSAEFTAARAQLAELLPLVDAATASMLETTLAAAEKREAELSASRREVAKLQQESLAQMQASLKQLSEATLAAKEAVAETTRLREELKTTPAVAAVAPVPPASLTPAALPETISVGFARGSTFLGGSNETKLLPAVEALERERRLLVQLRGHSDASGNTEYNAILARARCEIVRDFLVSKGIDTKRIEVISFGDTQAAASGKTAEELRRVDVIFRTE